MPCMLPLGESSRGVEIRVRVEPQHAQLLARVAAVARDGADRADRQTVIAAEQDRQPRVSELRADRFVDQAIPVGDLREVPIAFRRRLPRIRRAGEIAAVDDLAGRGCAAPRCRPATRSASGPIDAPRSLAPMSVGAPIRTAARFVLIRARPSSAHARREPAGELAEQILRILQRRARRSISRFVPRSS